MTTVFGGVIQRYILRLSYGHSHMAMGTGFPYPLPDRDGPMRRASIQHSRKRRTLRRTLGRSEPTYPFTFVLFFVRLLHTG